VKRGGRLPRFTGAAQKAQRYDASQPTHIHAPSYSEIFLLLDPAALDVDFLWGRGEGVLAPEFLFMARIMGPGAEFLRDPTEGCWAPLFRVRNSGILTTIAVMSSL
jgi:hypothetical protein